MNKNTFAAFLFFTHGMKTPDSQQASRQIHSHNTYSISNTATARTYARSAHFSIDTWQLFNLNFAPWEIGITYLRVQTSPGGAVSEC